MTAKRSRAKHATVRAGLIGTGHYGIALLCQARAISGLELRAVCDRKIERGHKALVHAGIAEGDVVFVDGPSAAARAYENGFWFAAEDASALMGLPLDVIVECTGDAEAGARHALAAIEHGKHVAMVNKETDCVVGPLLRHRAETAGVVYTAVAGDQHGLLMELVRWARSLGLEVVCGGKARDREFVYDAEMGRISDGETDTILDEAARESLRPIDGPECAVQARSRREALAALEHMANFDLAELTIAANATGLKPDTLQLHGFALRTQEIPRVLCPEDGGGVLRHRGVIEAVTCLRGSHEAGLGGGVFVVVACTNPYARQILVTKGLLANATGDYALIYRPYHLCGVETSSTILEAVLNGASTYSDGYRPRFDLTAVANVALPEGTVIETDGDPRIRGQIRPAARALDDSPIPLYLALGYPLQVDVPAGSVLTADMFEEPTNSLLWMLRHEQDAMFL